MARLVRRICLLREQGEAATAAQLEQNEFANLVRDFRLAEGPEALPESELRTMFANEERRVADAMVLAELLIPHLAGSITKVNRTTVQPSAVSTPEFPISFSRAAESPVGSTAIPDLLDAMLAADSAARRQKVNRLAT